LVYSFTKEVDIEQLQRLLRQTHWADKRSLEGVQHMLDHTPVCLTVWQGDRMVGFARMLTDDVYRALIDDVVVDNEFRGRGIGKGMMEHIVARFRHVEELMLGCLEDMVPFYEQFGFERPHHPHLELKPGRMNS
jgi:predicted GNAT family N-acyltransferase